MKPSLWLRWFERYRPQLFQVCVVSLMFAIGVWGHKTHWQFSPQAHAGVTDHSGHSDPKPSHSPKLIASPGANGGGSGAIGLIEFPTSQSVKQLGLLCQPVERRPVVGEITAAGVVAYEPTRLAQLSARVAGTVWRVEKQVGQQVRAGDVLAIIDAPDVGDAKAAFLHALADLQMCQTAYGRLNGFANGEVPFKQVQEAENALRKARVDLFNSQQALISLGLPINLKEWQSLPEEELQRRIKFLGLPEPLVSQLDPNATTATLLPLIAPFDGVVIGRELSKGEAVSPTQGHLEIADITRMWIVLHVRDQDVDALQLGQPMTFKVGSGSVAGTVSWMSTAVDEKTRTVEVRCETDNPEILDADGKPTGRHLLRANLFGTGKIQVRPSSDALVVPTRAVQRTAAGPVVFVRQGDNSFAVRPVQLGVVKSDFSEVISGLTVSDQVVVDGSHILKAEMQRMSADKPT